MSLVQRNLNQSLVVSTFVCVMYDARTKLADQVVAEVRDHFGDKVCRIVIPRTVRLSEAPSYGQPILAFDPRSRGAIAYRELAREVSGGAIETADTMNSDDRHAGRAMNRKSGLGRGLGALIPTEYSEVAVTDGIRGAFEVSIAAIRPEPTPAPGALRRGVPGRPDRLDRRDRRPPAGPGPRGRGGRSTS